MLQIDDFALQKYLTFEVLIDGLSEAFKNQNIVTPVRHHHQYQNPKENIESTLLLMPSWQESQYLGIKLITVSPNNFKYQIPSIQGKYLLFNAHTGVPLAMMDGKLLTNLRTAAASALASKILSNPQSSTLLMIGTGSLAPYLIQAHAAIRPLEKIWIWGRSFEKAQKISDNLKETLNISPIQNYQDLLSQVDIISAATLSSEPLVFGEYLRPGQHIDLVGSFKPDMREADDATMLRSKVFIDVKESAPKESGDLYLPIKNQVISPDHIKGDLFDLCSGQINGRSSEQEITLFKSVGHAMEDLVAAVNAYEASLSKDV
ncbi:MAG: ornithine cyclodeaminase family protein [Bacteroidota bacterium]